MRTILPESAWELAESRRAALIDVREPGEFGTLRVPGSVNVPLSVFEARVGTLPPGELLVMCAHGPRAMAAMKILSGTGRNATLVEGGITEWVRRGLPTETGGRHVIPMERQVRLGAGILVLLGLGLGWWVSPGYLLIAAFVGAGLTLSGVTGFCGMAMVLGRCPWNR